MEPLKFAIRRNVNDQAFTAPQTFRSLLVLHFSLWFEMFRISQTFTPRGTLEYPVNVLEKIGYGLMKFD